MKALLKPFAFLACVACLCVASAPLAQASPDPAPIAHVTAAPLAALGTAAFVQAVPSVNVLPAPSPINGPITPFVGVMLLIALLSGMIGQAVNKGSILGFKTTPQAWIPWLTLGGNALVAFGGSLTIAGGLTSTSLVNASVAAFLTLTAVTIGAKSHDHANAHKTPGPDASSSGGGGATVAAKVATAATSAFLTALAVVGLGAAVACTPPALPPNVAPDANSVIDATKCSLNVYAADTGKVPPASWEQVALDLAATCGMDYSAIVATFGATHPVSQAAGSMKDKIAATAAGAARK